MSSRKAYEDLIGKYLSGNIRSSEKKELFAWMEKTEENRLFFDQMVTLWGISTEYEALAYETDTETAWQKIEHKIVVVPPIKKATSPTETQIVKMPFAKRLLRIAAILIPLFLVGTWIFWGGSDTKLVLTTKGGENLEYQLPDGTKVWLNENSSLTFDTNFTKRQVALVGEAFFDVTKMTDRRFVITSGAATTTVFGTSFNVRAYPEEELVEVTVETGVVELAKAAAPATKVALKKGDSGIYEKTEQVVKKEAKAIVNATAWKTKTFNFEQRAIRDVMTSLERYFETDFSVENDAILNCNFKINNLQNPDINTIKELIEFETNGNIRLEKNDTGYIFKGRGCR